MIRKFITLVLILGSLYINNLVLAQRKATLVKISPQHFLAGTIKLDFERGLSKSASIYINPSYTMIDRRFEHATGPGLEIGFKKYFYVPEDEQLTGFYINGNLSFQYFNADYKKHERYSSYGIPYTIADTVFIKETITRFGGDLTLGYQLSAGRFYMDFFAGLDFKTGKSSLGKDSNFNFDALNYVCSSKAYIPKIGMMLGLRIN